MTDEKLNMLIDTACQVSEEFTKLFYEALDQKKHTLSKFYMEGATLAWDGNQTVGKDAIQKYFENLSGVTHTLHSMDAQPVSIEAVKGQQTILVQTAGRFSQKKSNSYGFSHSFVITAHDNKWKIFSHTCRLQRPITVSS